MWRGIGGLRFFPGKNCGAENCVLFVFEIKLIFTYWLTDQTNSNHFVFYTRRLTTKARLGCVLTSSSYFSLLKGSKHCLGVTAKVEQMKGAQLRKNSRHIILQQFSKHGFIFPFFHEKCIGPCWTLKLCATTISLWAIEFCGEMGSDLKSERAYLKSQTSCRFHEQGFITTVL